MLVPGAGNGSRSALCCSLSCRARGASSSSSFPSGGAGCSPSSCEAPLWQLWSGWGRGRPQGFLNRIIFSRINIAQLLGLGWFIRGLHAPCGAACVQGAELSSGSQRLCHCWKPKPGAFWPKYSALGVFPKEQPGQGGLVAPWLVVFWVSLQQPALQRRCQQRSSEPWQLPGFPVSSSSFISTICSSITGTNSDHGLVLGVMSPPRSPRHLPLLPSQLCAPRCGWGAAGSQDFGARLLAHFTGFGLFSCWGKGIWG